LEQLLETTASLNANVDIKSIFINLMEKLSKFVSSNQTKTEDQEEKKEGDISNIAGNLNIFKLFKKYTDKII
jgi:hypothetical protein